jgi:nucleoside-triphosphatase
LKQVYLLTGRPGTGKTSLIKQVASHMKGQAGGFYTEEIRSRGVREGFKLITLDGEETILAQIDIHSPYRVSKYGVDVDALDRVGVPALRKAVLQSNLVIIDEIGKMELFSDYFRKTVLWMIKSGKKVLGTILLNPDPWTDSIKRQPQVNLINLTRDNYRQVQEELFRWLGITEFLKL